jgi:hypothetical protein
MSPTRKNFKEVFNIKPKCRIMVSVQSQQRLLEQMHFFSYKPLLTLFDAIKAINDVTYTF